MKIIKKRTLKSKNGDKEITKIVTMQKSNEKRQTEVSIHEESASLKEQPQPWYIVEELPLIQETVVVEGGVTKKRARKKRIIKKKA